MPRSAPSTSTIEAAHRYPGSCRVAVLAVVDTEPRELSSAELAVLREYAIRVGDVLFENY